MEVPIADQSEYRPPTQSQKPNIFLVSIPNLPTPAALVESAAKCLATAASSLAAASSQALALLALVMVSWVVKVLDATRKSVVSGFKSLVVSAMWVPSTLDTKWTLRSPA